MTALTESFLTSSRKAYSMPTLPLDSIDWSRFRRVLNHPHPAERRDSHQRLLDVGTWVLANPASPREFLEDTPSNRSRFVEQSFGWSSQTRQTLVFPTVTSLDASFQEKLRSAQRRCGEFFLSIQENLEHARGSDFPEETMGWLETLIPFEYTAKIRSVKLESNLDREWVAEVLATMPGIPEKTPITREWADLLASLNGLRVYRIRGRGRSLLVSVAVVTRIAFHAEAPPEFLSTGIEVQSILRKLVDRQFKKEYRRGTVLYSLGLNHPATDTTTPATDTTTPDVDDTPPRDLVVSVPVDEKNRPPGWRSVSANLIRFPRAVQDFHERLKPETWERLLERIEHAVRAILDTNQLRATARRVAEVTRLRGSVVQRALESLARHCPHLYVIEREVSASEEPDETFLRTRRRGETVRESSEPRARILLRDNMVRLASVGIATLAGLAASASKTALGYDGWRGLAITVAIMYAGSVVQAGINRRARRKNQNGE